MKQASWTHNAPAYQISAKSGNARLSIDESTMFFSGPFFRRRPYESPFVLTDECTELNQIGTGHAPEVLLDFRDDAPFRNDGDAKATGIEN